MLVSKVIEVNRGNAGMQGNASKHGNNTGMLIAECGNVWLVVWFAVMKAMVY